MSNHKVEIGICFLTFQFMEVQKRVKNPDNAVTWEVVLAGSYYVETKPEMLVRDRRGGNRRSERPGQCCGISLEASG